MSAACPEWSHAEIGHVAELLMHGATEAAIAEAVGAEDDSDMEDLHALIVSIKDIGRTHVKVRRSDGGRGKARERSVTEREEIMATVMHRRGDSAESIADALGCGVGAVRYVLEHPREEMMG